MLFTASGIKLFNIFALIQYEAEGSLVNTYNQVPAPAF